MMTERSSFGEKSSVGPARIPLPRPTTGSVLTWQGSEVELPLFWAAAVTEHTVPSACYVRGAHPERRKGAILRKKWLYIFHTASLHGPGPSSSSLGGSVMLRTPSLWQIFYPWTSISLFFWPVTKGVSGCPPTQSNQCQVLFWPSCVGSLGFSLQEQKRLAVISFGASLVSQSSCQVVFHLDWRRERVSLLNETHREYLSEKHWPVSTLMSSQTSGEPPPWSPYRFLIEHGDTEICHVSSFVSFVAHTLFPCVSYLLKVAIQGLHVHSCPPPAPPSLSLDAVKHNKRGTQQILTHESMPACLSSSRVWSPCIKPVFMMLIYVEDEG